MALDQIWFNSCPHALTPRQVEGVVSIEDSPAILSSPVGRALQSHLLVHLIVRLEFKVIDSLPTSGFFRHNGYQT